MKSTPKPSQPSASTASPLDAASRDVVDYIAGAILHKLKAQYHRLRKDDHSDSLSKLSLVRQLPHEDHTYAMKSLIDLKNRGGLTHPVAPLVELLCAYHGTFQICRQQEAIHLLDLAGYKECEALAGHDVVHDCVKLFRKICTHHECFKFIERKKWSTGCTGKGKALRIKLCDKNTL